MGVDRHEWPLMVRVGLWGIHSRGVAWSWFVLSLAVAIGGVVYGFVNPIGNLAGLMAFAALGYLFSIRWVDRYGSWS